MEYTPLHRLFALPPGPVDDALIERAVKDGVSETDDLDWKEQLPPIKGLSSTDFVKDVAAFANARGGIIVYGVTETGGAADGRKDVGEFTEADARTMATVAATALQPAVLGVRALQVGDIGQRAVVVIIPASFERPHLIVKNQDLRAPVRNGPDTIWMSERLLAAAYRQRFAAADDGVAALDRLYTATAETLADPADRAWGIAVARPRVPAPPSLRPTQDEARDVLFHGRGVGFRFAAKHHHALDEVYVQSPRPSLRSWTARSIASDSEPWRSAAASVHFDGAVALAAALGGQPFGNGDEFLPVSQFPQSRLETLVCDVYGLIKAAADRTGGREYDVRVGVAWEGGDRLLVLRQDNTWANHLYSEGSLPLARFTPVDATIDAATDDAGIKEQAIALATDCVNQGGIQYPSAFTEPDPRYSNGEVRFMQW